MRFVGERRAVAALVLALFGLQFVVNALLGPSPLMPMFLALGLVYMAGFVGVVAGYFWARWYCLGLATSGLLLTAMLLWQVGLELPVLIWGVPHLALALSLLGRGPASAFDGRPDWRERFKMDEQAANRLGKSITRAGASLPYLIMAGLAPKQDLALAGALVLGILGVVAIVKLRSWGVLALGGAAALAGVGLWSAEVADCACDHVIIPSLGVALDLPAVAVPVAFVLLVAATAPFLKPMARFLTRRW